MNLTPNEVVERLQRTIPLLEEEAAKGMRAAVDLTEQRMSEFAPRGATGELSRDITHSVRHGANGVTGLVRPRSPHAGFVNDGTGEGKTVRTASGGAYSASGRVLSAGEEAANPGDALTASGWGSRTGRPLALHLPGGVAFRQHVRGQRAQHFVERTREAVGGEVETILTDVAAAVTDRLFP